uniref:DegT/DnrJ/EryC1/StrS family aminotransferase n=1 Tax=Roseihalotalea indica TaxID=2867963 RepID=A0AA49JIV1_9BACT|nr:DegT/DnrJ/EryC1/StrS family aminotransferase [Tunicatimonas sp. TK19036]
MIPVTKPFLPPQNEYQEYIRGIWQRNWLTNNGPLVNELELRLKDYLGVSHLLYVTNGTIALQFAIRALELKGQIITTPFSYVATTSSVVWEECEPIFVDIDPLTCNIDPAKIEDTITENTKAILTTHVFGYPSDIEAIQEIANKHNLKVIYDAAHCFGSKYKGNSVFSYGDISTCSFHATKLFHTIEGGAVFTENPDLLKKMALMRNFGHTGEFTFGGVGINGKNSEFHAAMGLANIKYIHEILEKREKLISRYHIWRDQFTFDMPITTENMSINNAYFPVILKSEEEVVKVYEALKGHEIFARRYFYPTLTQLPYVKYIKCPCAEDIAKRILCLPLYHELDSASVDMICRIIIRTLKYQ